MSNPAFWQYLFCGLFFVNLGFAFWAGREARAHGRSYLMGFLICWWFSPIVGYFYVRSLRQNFPRVGGSP